ncbi:hypothetical protein CLF_111965 [Clonorchis sinensis]|uniref:Uncharacterized protein n=1 Tax=Clonorchis sinensis TaxID=79923 RepID=G7YM57_CLOSI|nr:hypothetical protein CLF_111965 [Clonorchis sinensis]
MKNTTCGYLRVRLKVALNVRHQQTPALTVHLTTFSRRLRSGIVAQGQVLSPLGFHQSRTFPHTWNSGSLRRRQQIATGQAKSSPPNQLRRYQDLASPETQRKRLLDGTRKELWSTFGRRTVTDASVFRSKICRWPAKFVGVTPALTVHLTTFSRRLRSGIVAQGQVLSTLGFHQSRTFPHTWNSGSLRRRQQIATGQAKASPPNQLRRYQDLASPETQRKRLLDGTRKELWSTFGRRTVTDASVFRSKICRWPAKFVGVVI